MPKLPVLLFAGLCIAATPALAVEFRRIEPASHPLFADPAQAALKAAQLKRGRMAVPSPILVEHGVRLDRNGQAHYRCGDRVVADLRGRVRDARATKVQP